MGHDHSDKILGCLFGGALGDALGARSEGECSVPDVDHTCPLYLTDDTQLTLATCEAIVDAGRVDAATIARQMTAWFRRGALTGLGASTYKSLTELAAGGHWALVGRRGEQAHGNGAAMRITPLAFCLSPEDLGARQTIRDVCRITHHSDEAYAGALAVLAAVRAARGGDWAGGGDLLPIATRHLPDCRVRERLLELTAIPRGTPIQEVAIRYGCSGYVVESVPLAIFAAAHAGDTPLEDIFDAINATRGDTDTIASIVGQIMGTLRGYAQLPRPLMDRLHDRDAIDGIATMFCDVVESCGGDAEMRVKPT